MELETLVKIIESSSAVVCQKELIGQLDGDLNFNREIVFTVGDKDYKIVWYKNMSTLYIDENTQVMFDDVKCQNTWPVCTTKNSKNQLQFMYGSDKVCIMITERY